MERYRTIDSITDSYGPTVVAATNYKMGAGLRVTRPTSLSNKQVVGPTISVDKQQQQNKFSKNIFKIKNILILRTIKYLF